MIMAGNTAITFTCSNIIFSRRLEKFKLSLSFTFQNSN